MDDLSVFNSSSALSSKDLDRSSNRSFNASLLAFSLTDFFTFFTGLVVVFFVFVAVAVVSAMVVTAATSAEANACFPNDVFVVVVEEKLKLVNNYSNSYSGWFLLVAEIYPPNRTEITLRYLLLRLEMHSKANRRFRRHRSEAVR